jgi:hypothetical protein
MTTPTPQTVPDKLRGPTPLPRPQIVISRPDAPLTWLEGRAKGGLFIGQGRNKVLLNRAEVAKFIATARQLDASQPAYSTSTPAKKHAQLMRYEVKKPTSDREPSNTDPMPSTL